MLSLGRLYLWYFSKFYFLIMLTSIFVALKMRCQFSLASCARLPLQTTLIFYGYYFSSSLFDFQWDLLSCFEGHKIGYIGLIRTGSLFSWVESMVGMVFPTDLSTFDIIALFLLLSFSSIRMDYQIMFGKWFLCTGSKFRVIMVTLRSDSFYDILVRYCLNLKMSNLLVII